VGGGGGGGGGAGGRGGAAAGGRGGARPPPRNLPDGSVEAVFEGPADAVDALVEWSRHGPRLAVVKDVRVQAEPPEGITGFQIR
jgi:acylphosphatase